MAKRKSALELAIHGIEDEIAALEIARNHLIRQRPTAPKAKPTPRRTPGLPRVLAHAGDEAS